jgi:hypothetical protein
MPYACFRARSRSSSHPGQASARRKREPGWQAVVQRNSCVRGEFIAQQRHGVQKNAQCSLVAHWRADQRHHPDEHLQRDLVTDAASQRRAYRRRHRSDALTCTQRGDDGARYPALVARRADRRDCSAALVRRSALVGSPALPHPHATRTPGCIGRRAACNSSCVF